MDQEIWEQFKDWLWDTLTALGPKIALAIFMLVGGIILIRLLARLLNKTFRRSRVEPSLRTFLESLIKFALYTILIVSIGTTIGIKTSSFVAIIGAAGIAIGLALQGSLANFAGGVLILIFKPFKVGDLIYVNDKLGTVAKIDILYTRLVTFDNRIITMPNGNVANSDVDNRTMQESRRIGLDLKFDYNADIKAIRRIVVDTLKQHPKVLAAPAPDLWLDSIGEYELKVTARCWVRPEDYWPVIWEQYEAVKEALEEAGIPMPIQKQEVYWKGVPTKREATWNEQN
ncbi:MAG: mechanosensitive ion channel [Bacteroidetes bacterium]|jgi:small conductance mechanosensitive channel|nr:mechanosensitive ion channel [Bacteroidota bacterium]